MFPIIKFFPPPGMSNVQLKNKVLRIILNLRNNFIKYLTIINCITAQLYSVAERVLKSLTLNNHQTAAICYLKSPHSTV